MKITSPEILDVLSCGGKVKRRCWTRLIFSKTVTANSGADSTTIRAVLHTSNAGVDQHYILTLDDLSASDWHVVK